MARHLDKEFANAIKANDFEFNWMRLPSVMELCGELAEEYVIAAQSKFDHSRKKSLVTAFQTFWPMHSVFCNTISLLRYIDNYGHVLG